MSDQWFALQVKSRYEQAVATHLGGIGYERFLPLYKSRRRWSDRFKEFELPLFPGYVFCRLDLSNRLPVLMTPGVTSIVGAGKIPLPIDEVEMRTIQAAITSGLRSEPWPHLQIGQRVKMKYGPLCGLEGILVDRRGRHDLIVSVTLLQRSIAVQVDRDWVSPLSSSYALAPNWSVSHTDQVSC